MKMTQKQCEKWAKIRQMGRRRYVWLFGVAGWGLTTAVFWSVLMAYLKGWDQLPVFLILALIGFPIGGYFYGRLMWKWSEASFQRANPNG